MRCAKCHSGPPPPPAPCQERTQSPHRSRQVLSSLLEINQGVVSKTYVSRSPAPVSCRGWTQHPALDGLLRTLPLRWQPSQLWLAGPRPPRASPAAAALRPRVAELAPSMRPPPTPLPPASKAARPPFPGGGLSRGLQPCGANSCARNQGRLSVSQLRFVMGETHCPEVMTSDLL